MNWAWRLGAVALCVTSLSACAVMYDPHGVFNNVVSGGQASTAESALAAYQKGDFARSESLAKDVLRINPKDAYALMALAETYQATGRPELAKQYFTSIVSLNPPVSLVQGGVSTPVAQIARDHLAQLNAPFEPVKPPPELTAAELGVASDNAVITRFQTLSQLLDMGLISRDEYNARRGANLGALLPYTAPPPAARITLGAPRSDELIGRLSALTTLYGNKEITSPAFAAERNAILDALMPVTDGSRAYPPAPISDDLGASAALGRLQRLFDAKVITAREMAREKGVIEQQLAMNRARAEAAARATSGMMPPVPLSASGQGVHLASYNSERQALAAWPVLIKRFPEQLGSLQPSVTKTVLRRGRTYYRLSAGPLADRKAAQAVCRVLARRHQFCEPAIIK